MHHAGRTSRNAMIFALAVATVCSSPVLVAQSKPNSIFQVLNVPFHGVGPTVISATSANNIWTVSPGIGNSSATSVSLNFDGRTWTKHTMAGSMNLAFGLAAISSNDVWAAGDDLNFVTGSESEVVEHFEGTQWKVVPDVDLIGKELVINGVDEGLVLSEVLNGISAISANDIFAGGFVMTDNIIAPFVEHWNGTKWSLTPPLPFGQAVEVFVEGISALADNDVWAVGFTNINALAGVAESWHFDGKKWTEIAGAPNCFCAFDAVTAIAANDVWAVGYLEFPNNGFLDVPMAQHWNGTNWTLTPIPNPDINAVTGQGIGFQFQSVAAVSSASVWAVSSREDFFTFLTQPYLEHWNGNKWSLELLPFCPLPECSLSGVTALATGQVWTSGASSFVDAPNNPFVLFTSQGK